MISVVTLCLLLSQLAYSRNISQKEPCTSQNTVTIQENFEQACSQLQFQQNTTNWVLPVDQWGGNINGGVSGENVNCRQDPVYGSVLQLFLHGDLYTGHGPTGTAKNGNPIQSSSNWVGWKNGGYEHDCRPNCNVQRVGASILSKLAFTSARISALIKPCSKFGAASVSKVCMVSNKISAVSHR